jgi:glycosyltransferase involved in cell wall biosynthesis
MGRTDSADEKVRADLLTTSLAGKRVLVLLHSGYPGDPRPRREAEALCEAGMDVEVVAIMQDPSQLRTEVVSGVKVLRLPMQKSRSGKIGYILNYAVFVAACLGIVAWRVLFRRYHFVHVHNMPDFLVLAALPAKLLGARVILDLHDPMPELMRSIYGFDEKHWVVGLLRTVERWSIAVSDRVLTVNLACRRIFSGRSCEENKIEVVMNAPDERIFEFKEAAEGREADESKPFVFMYHGSIVARHGLDLAVEALSQVAAAHPNVELHVYGARNDYLDETLAKAQNLGMRERVIHFGPTDQRGIARAIDACDVGLIPNRRSIFTEINTPTRIFEYLARGKPVIAPDSRGITEYFEEDELVFFRLGDAGHLAEKMRLAIEDPAALRQSSRRGQRVFLRHRWSSQRARFLGAIKDMVRGNAAEYRATFGQG